MLLNALQQLFANPGLSGREAPRKQEPCVSGAASPGTGTARGVYGKKSMDTPKGGKQTLNH